ncbi:hypothetical protein [Alkaliflexus imshenetskii]|uniref:hypothetical protein n=1 Tax=Alkaliflexus imshenetskii TaxID=286730 RepID=UPI00047D2CF5|nr:hypothetical protein [Alkaliflexus imshenetskii]
MKDFEPSKYDFSIELPNDTDRLFNDCNIDYRHNAILRSGKKWFMVYSEAYRLAAEKLFEQLDGSAYISNHLVYPIVFLSRQYIELSLKELINGLNYVRIEKYTFPCDHKLKSLWDKYVSLSSNINKYQKPEETVLKNMERLISEFEEIDTFSMNFRFPTDKSEERKPSLKRTNIDLENFRITMSKISNFLTWQSNAIYDEIDKAEEYYYSLWEKLEIESDKKDMN